MDNEHLAILYYPNFKGNELNLRIYKYVNEFNLIFSKDMRYTPINAEIVKNEFYKINNNRAIFVTSANNNLYFYLFDFFNEYTKIIISIYEYDLSYYDIVKDITFYYFNNFIYFTAAYYYYDMCSLLIVFGYSNGNDISIDISPYLLDNDNSNININIFDFF